MRRFKAMTTALAVVAMMGATTGMAIEEAAYDVVLSEGPFEIRDYRPQILAETIVEGSLEDAGDKAFRPLFRYISGDNRTRAKIAMTTPVAQEPRSAKIAMTAPVGQQRVESGWAVSFLMPSGYSLDALPLPVDPAVTLRETPARRLAAVRYSGFWSEKRYTRHRKELEAWLGAKGLAVAGEPIWARYNPPFTPWFMRRNEILIPVAMPEKAGR